MRGRQSVHTQVVDVDPGDPQMVADLFPVMRQLRPRLDADGFAAMYAEGYPQCLRYAACFDAEGRCAGVAGWRLLATSRGRILFVDDLVTTAERRSQGVGRELLAWLEERGRRAGCVRLELDSGVQNAAAHGFYFRECMRIAAFHFAKELMRSEEA